MKDTAIGWCDSTINPTTGCEGCELWNGRDIRLCYAGNLHENRLAKSFPDLYAADFQEVRGARGRMMKAAGWSDLRGKDRHGKPWLNGKPRMVFVGDMGDFCSKSVPDDYIVDEIVGAVDSAKGKRHFWLLLNKTNSSPSSSFAQDQAAGQLNGDDYGDRSTPCRSSHPVAYEGRLQVTRD